MESIRSSIVRTTEAEAIYTRERQRTNRERFRAYYADFYAAYDRRDYRRIVEIVQDATTITNDTMRLTRRMSAIRLRRRALASRVGFVAEPASPSSGARGLHVIGAERGADSPDAR
ncbi:MAG: hypothetical protein M3Y58_02145 [Chloroflexota bacterium]|nr:hypothetical protein [Chloroflexota bacterium]